MSFLAGLGFTSEKPPIVIEFGSRYTKAGFGGEPGPRVIVATPDNLRAANAQVESISSFMLWLYNVHLQISPRERRIAIVEKSSESENFRERVAVAALKFIAAPGLIFITRPVASVTGCGIASNTGLVVNLGWSEFTVATVVHGVPLIWNEKSSEQSVQQMAAYLQKEVLATNEKIDEELFPLKYAEDVLARLAYCVGIEDEWNQKQREKVEELETDGVNVVNLKRGQVMDAVDLMWTKYAENNRLSTMVLDALLEAPIDSRRALAGNIILSGGGASMPGLNRRLLQEINHQLAEERYEKLANLDYRLTSLPCKPSYMSWLGGSVYSCGESAWRHQIESKTSEDGSVNVQDLPDWHTNPLPEPKVIPSRPSVSSLSANSPIRRMLQMSTSRSSILSPHKP